MPTNIADLPQPKICPDRYTEEELQAIAGYMRDVAYHFDVAYVWFDKGGLNIVQRVSGPNVQPSFAQIER